MNEELTVLTHGCVALGLLAHANSSADFSAEGLWFPPPSRQAQCAAAVRAAVDPGVSDPGPNSTRDVVRHDMTNDFGPSGPRFAKAGEALRRTTAVQQNQAAPAATLIRRADA